jgi:opacity protein-like surface antigen
MSLPRWIMSSAIAGAFAVALTAPAHADGDTYWRLPREAPTYVEAIPFQGFYIGASAGGAWAVIGDNRTDGFIFPNFPNDETLVRRGELTSKGVFGGLQFGYNWQNGNCCFVFGIEVDAGGMDNSNNQRNIFVPSATDPATSAGLKVRGSGGLYADVTGRAGLLWGASLYYVKGGLAWWGPSFSLDETLVVAGNPAFAVHRTDDNLGLVGWTLGIGAEYMLNPSWTFKIEYLHFDFGSSDSDCCFDGTNRLRLFRGDITVDTAKVGFNYLIHPPIAALK